MQAASMRSAERRGPSSPRLVLVVMCVGYFLVLLDVTVVNVALPRIGAGLDAGVSDLQWVVDGGVRAPVLAAIALAAGLLGAFLRVEGRARDPMLPLGLFRHADFSTSNAVAATMNLASLGLIFVLTLFLQRVRSLSALEAGVTVLPVFTPLGLLAPLAGRLAARTGARLPITIGLLTAAAGIALLVLVDERSGELTLVPAMLLWGVGLAILTPAVVAAAVGAVPAERAGLASAVNNTARQAGGAIGIAAFGALAGQPGSGGFISGFHTAAAIGAGLYTAAAIATLTVPRVGGLGRSQTADLAGRRGTSARRC